MIDFHCHLDLYPDPHGAVRRAVEARAHVLSVTTTPSAWEGTNRLAGGAGRIRTALGLHPELAHQRRSELALFDALVGRTRYVGEIGLDGSPEAKPHQKVQDEVFRHVLRTSARAGGRVLTIHSRRAADPVLDALRAEPDAGVPVLHWFSGSAAQLRRAVDQGCWFSVGPAMCRSKRGLSLVAAMPRERLLTETDGPLARDGSAPLQPAQVAGAVTVLADLWRVSVEEVHNQLRTNLAVVGRAVQAQG